MVSEMRRKDILTGALLMVGIQEVRRDSSVARKWIMGSEDLALDAVVEHICRAKFLHEYCNFDLGYHIAKGILEWHGSRFDKQHWLNIIQRCVLLTSTGVFPERWPWLDDVSPQQWKSIHDHTSTFISI